MKNIDKDKETHSIIIAFDKEIIDNYKIVCEEQGFNMSQRIRNFVKKENETFLKK